MVMVRTLAIVALATFGSVLAQERDRTWGTPEELCLLNNEEINESSGVASSPSQTGVFYTHNDSGDSARFFRFSRSGKIDGTFSLKGAKALDWEDMAAAIVEGKGYLYFGDIGDNAEDRANVVVHRVAEPTAGGDQAISAFESYTIKYPDGPHNCEGMFVTTSGDIWVVTKNVGGNSKVFVLSKPKGNGTYVFRHVADLSVDTGGLGGKYVTGAAVSPDGKHVVVRTYTAALEFLVPAKFDDWSKSKPSSVRTALEIQGEAICYSKNGKSLVTTSESAPCAVSIISLKGL